MSEAGHTVPAPTSAPVGAPGSSGLWRLVDAMGEHARGRSQPTFDGAIGAAGGALVGGGMVALGGGHDVSRGGIAVVGLLLVAAGLVARLALGPRWRALRTAAVAAGAVGIVAFAAVAPSPDSDQFLRVFLLVATAGFVAAWVAPGYRGHPAMLAIALVTFAALVADLVGRDDGGFSSPFSFGFGGISTATGQVLLLIGLGYLGGVWFFDRRGYVGVGTAFAVASLLAVTLGAAIVAADLGDTGGSFLLLAVGAIVCGVGARSDRRATAWWGAALCGAGAASFTLSLFDPESTNAGGLTIALTGAALIGAATLFANRDRLRSSNASPSTPPVRAAGPSLPPPPPPPKP